MKNLGQILRLAQQAQERMAELQQKLESTEVGGTAGGGMVSATVNGHGQVKRIKIDPSLVDPKEVEILEDLVAAAVNDAVSKAKAMQAEETMKLTGGMNLPPGLKLPF
ncbi:MAG: YbaB/EbfC family nucleoid-associated protein [Proteobacteria bacterium]|nr:YbaB/EbfC family nucleoid-associated protein [Pseudomonadota bacterium]